MSTVVAPPASPFKGLAAFEDSELDALFFFGRERDRAVLVANLMAARLTVLYGESGVGKSSLLGAGVARELRALAPEAVVALRDTWSGSVEDVLDEVRGAGEAYLILDQFEEYFLYHGEDDEPGALLHDLPELLRDSRVNVLVSLREDSLARLDAFKARIPSVFGNQVRLEHLDRDAARSAILGPIVRWNELTGDPVEIEPELVEAVLDEVTRDGDRIEAPYLQLVLERIWHSERAEGSRLLRLETLRRLGGAAAIVRDHLQGALAGLDAEEQDVAASMFEHLVTPSGTKIAHRAPDLAEYANVPEGSLRRVLAALTRDRIVHSVDGSDRYEIFHDVLAEPIRTWRQQRRLERERLTARRRQRRLVAVAVLALLALAIVAGLAIWALSERSGAQSQAQHAHARELEATALQRLLLDPNRSVSLALAAARLEPGRAGEEVLRQALFADRLRLVRHTHGKVSAVAASPLGDLIAAAVVPRTVLLLDAHNRRLVRTIATPRHVSDVRFAADGRTLITVSPLRIADAWDVRTGRRLPLGPRSAAARLPDGQLELVPLRGRLARVIPHVRALSAAPGGHLLAATLREPNGHVRTWVFDRNGRLRYTLRPLGVQDIAFSPDGRLLATSSAEGFTHVWTALTGAKVRALHDSKDGAKVVAFSPDGRLLASGGQDSAVRVWKVATWEKTHFLFGHTNPVTTLAWSPDARVIASASADRTVRLWRLHGLVGAGYLAGKLSVSDAPVETLAFTADSTRLVTGGDDGNVRVWDAAPDQQLELLGRAAGSAVAGRWAANTIVAAWSSGVVKIYDARTRKLEHVLRSETGGFTSLDVSADGGVVAAGLTDGTTQVWDGRSGDPLRPGPGTAAVTAVAVAPHGDLVASGDGTGAVRVWDPHTGGLVGSPRQAGRIFDLAFAPAGDRLVSGGARGAVIWSAAGRLLHRLRSPGSAVSVAFGPDGRLVATAGSDHTGRLWFARTGDPYRVMPGHRRPLTDIEFSDDGRQLATSSKDSDGRIWSVDQGLGHLLERLSFGPLRAIDFDHTGRWVAAAAPISVIFWAGSSGRELFYVRGHTARVTGVTFAPRGPTVLSSSRDGTVRTYTCEVCVGLNALVHLAEHRLAQTR